MTVGVTTADYTRVYHAKQSTGGFVRAEMVSTEMSDLFNPVHFSEIEIDGVIGADANETVSLLNAIMYNSGEGTGGGGISVEEPIDAEESTIDGVTDAGVKSVSILFLGDGGSLNGVAVPDKFTAAYSANKEIDTIGNIGYTVPISGEQRVIITYIR
jgi:hypothetical protein